MNIIAVDIGNTNIKIALFLDGQQAPTVKIGGDQTDRIAEVMQDFWSRLPVAPRSTEGKRDGVIVFCSVKPSWSQAFKDICRKQLDEKALEIGIEKDIPLPIKMSVEYPANVGVDRVVAAAAAYFVVDGAVIVADIGTAITVDLVDNDGDFLGGVIAPGFDLSAKSLKENTALLPEVTLSSPKSPMGINTEEAINNGIYYSVVGLLETVSRKYAEQLGQWPQMIVTGSGAHLIKQDCGFVDDWVDELVLKGVVIAYKFHIDKLKG